MYEKVFVDANIIIDLIDDDRKYHLQTIKVFEYFIDKNIELYTSCVFVTTIYYIINKYAKTKINSLIEIEKINEIFTVIPFDNQDIEKTVDIMRQNSSFKDFEDALQYHLAKKIGCEVIITNDKGFVSDGVKVFDIEKFYNFLSSSS